MREFNIKQHTHCRLKNIAVIFMLAMVLILTAGIQPSDAIFTLELSDGSTIITIEDNDANDSLNYLDGGILFNGYLGVFNLSVTTALSKGIIGSDALPELYLSSVGISSAGPGGTLTIKLGDTDFDTSEASVTSRYVSYLGGTLSGTLKYDSYIDNGNDLWGTEHKIADLGTYYPGDFSGEYVSSEQTTPGTFSMTTIVTLTHGIGNRVSSFSSYIQPDPNYENTIVPEPVSSLLFVIGVAVMASRRLRSSWKKR